jgi:hypothetical protein
MSCVETPLKTLRRFWRLPHLQLMSKTSTKDVISPSGVTVMCCRM